MAEMMSDAEIVAEFNNAGVGDCIRAWTWKGCDPASIRDPEKIRRFIIELCDLIDMHRFGEPQIIHFGPNERVAGFSMTQLIETSLVSGHFANETNAAYLDIFRLQGIRTFKGSGVLQELFWSTVGDLPGTVQGLKEDPHTALTTATTQRWESHCHLPNRYEQVVPKSCHRAGVHGSNPPISSFSKNWPRTSSRIRSYASGDPFL